MMRFSRSAFIRYALLFGETVLTESKTTSPTLRRHCRQAVANHREGDPAGHRKRQNPPLVHSRQESLEKGNRATEHQAGRGSFFQQARGASDLHAMAGAMIQVLEFNCLASRSIFMLSQAKRILTLRIRRMAPDGAERCA